MAVHLPATVARHGRSHACHRRSFSFKPPLLWPLAPPPSFPSSSSGRRHHFPEALLVVAAPPCWSSRHGCCCSCDQAAGQAGLSLGRACAWASCALAARRRRPSLAGQIGHQPARWPPLSQLRPGTSREKRNKSRGFSAEP